MDPFFAFKQSRCRNTRSVQSSKCPKFQVIVPSGKSSKCPKFEVPEIPSGRSKCPKIQVSVPSAVHPKIYGNPLWERECIFENRSGTKAEWEREKPFHSELWVTHLTTSPDILYLAFWINNFEIGKYHIIGKVLATMFPALACNDIHKKIRPHYCDQHISLTARHWRPENEAPYIYFLFGFWSRRWRLRMGQQRRNKANIWRGHYREIWWYRLEPISKNL